MLRLVSVVMLSFGSRSRSLQVPVVVPSASPLTRVELRGQKYWVKRDDKLVLGGEGGAGISGNKARKLLSFALNQKSEAGIVASMGGHQSNAMVAMAALCRARGLRMLYLSKTVPRWLRKNPAGNYARGLALGVELIPLQADAYRRCTYDTEYRDALLHQFVDDQDQIQWLPQGAAYPDAEYGISLLAQELGDAFQGAPLRLLLPGGTGTTAMFLARHLADHAHGSEVFCVPCGTTAKGLQNQMRHLDAASGSLGIFPTILDLPSPPNEPKFRFGTPSQREWQVWNELKDAGLFLDLLYAPHTWDVFLRAMDPASPPSSLRENKNNDNLVYLHCGGLEGVATLLTRYRRAGYRFDDDGDSTGPLAGDAANKTPVLPTVGS